MQVTYDGTLNPWWDFWMMSKALFQQRRFKSGSGSVSLLIEKPVVRYLRTEKKGSSYTSPRKELSLKSMPPTISGCGIFHGAWGSMRFQEGISLTSPP